MPPLCIWRSIAIYKGAIMALGVPDPQLEEAVVEEEENLHPYAEPLPEDAGTLRRLAHFLKSDHPYVLLGTSALAAFSLACCAGMSLGAAGSVLTLVCVAWLALSLVALVAKAVLRKRYRSRFVLAKASLRAPLRYASYLVWICSAALFCLGPISHFVALCQGAIASSTNPTGFLESAVYMLYNGRQLFVTGVTTTIELALFGTVIAFFLALLMVFLRIQTPDRGENDAVRFFKTLGSGFARFYSTVVRGTPMMGQGAIVYFAGLAVFRSLGWETAHINAVWSPFWAGLVTISLNSTAYMMEVLRGGIEAVDPGQLEAARSLGLSQWQAMRKVVFPQGVKNSIPALSNELIVNIKDSSVLSIIGVFDLMFATTSVIGIYYKGLEAYCIAAVIYLILTMLFSKILTMFAARLDVQAPGPVGSTTDPAAAPRHPAQPMQS